MKIFSSILVLVVLITPGLTQTIDLLTAAGFTGLAVSGITSSGVSTVTGNIGFVNKGVAGFPPGLIVGGTVPGLDAIQLAQADANGALTEAQPLASTGTLPASIGSGQIFSPGIYLSRKDVALSETLTLSRPGTFIFHITSQFSSANGSQVVLTDGAQASDVFFAVGDTTNFGSENVIVGNVLSTDMVTLGEGTTFEGLLSTGANIVMDSNEVAFAIPAEA